MSTQRIAVRVLVGNHTHRGRRCVRGEIIHLRHWQVEWLGASVQRVHGTLPQAHAPESVALPSPPDQGGDEAGGDESPDDPEPEPESPSGADDWLRPAGGDEQHRQQGAPGSPTSPPALTLQSFLAGGEA